MAIQISKYKRPGIYIEEINKSIIPTQNVDNNIYTLVIGVSKKGPVNNLVTLKNIKDLETIYGPLDRNLEKKGSYFHRTIAKMLESGPVLAMNLLLTDDNLDVIEYKSLSSASNHKNDIKREGPYRRFFDTTGFWKRDTESFINLTKNNPGYSNRLINFTNLSDKPITIFIFKSKIQGYDKAIINWYGTIDNLPKYLNPEDYASDYMVDVVVVGGDWSNYQDLSVHSEWANYFNPTGLIKSKINDFINNKKVNLLAYYEGLSLIPFFRNNDGKNIFIETVINRDTDKTGLFCAFNSDLFETDYPNGLVDLNGNNIANSEQNEIEFLSYKETITENIPFTYTILDRPGNVLSFGCTGPQIDNSSRDVVHAYGNTPATNGIVVNGNRTGWFAEDYIYNLKLSTITSSTVSITVSYAPTVISNPVVYAVMGGNYVTISNTPFTFSISGANYPTSGTTMSYTVTFVLNSNGNITMVDTLTPTTNPIVNPNDLVLGYVTFSITNNIINTGSVFYNPICAATYGFVELLNDVDYDITQTTPGSIKIEFLNTANVPNVTNYHQFRKIKYFNKLINALDSPNKKRMTMVIDNTMVKKSMENMTISNIVTSSTQNKSFVINTGLPASQLNYIINNGFVLFYLNDDEFIINNSPDIETKESIVDFSSSSSSGVVSKYSDMYIKYYDGLINTKDYFWLNLVNPNTGIPDTIIFIDGENAPSNNPALSGFDYIVFHCTHSTFATSQLANLNVNDVIMLPYSNLNKGTFTILSGGGTTATTLATALGYSGSGYYAYKVNEEVNYEELFISNNQTNVVYNYLNKVYLRTYIDGSNNLKIKLFEDADLTSVISNFNTTSNQTIYVYSRINNYKQTVEIETDVNGYVPHPNKILVNASRYSEIKVGDFLEAFVDTSTLSSGQMPRKLTRIINKKLYPGNPDLVEITCDSRIATYNFNGDYQTYRYMSIENYVNTYKAITLKGFKIRQESLPDGTETRQNQILNLVAKGTPLYKALTNKEAVDFRYLVDSFGLGLTEKSKQQLVDICGGRMDVFGFINMPSIKQFKNSTSPTFVNNENVLQVELIAKGGDPESSPAFLYSFGEGLGSTSVGYFTPYVSVNDNGKPIFVPPAMFVATAYMRKHISNLSNMTPWTIIAGVTNGKITGINGLEIDYTPEDIEWLNQANMNPIVFKKNKGWVIETQNTAEKLYKSALSYIHVREVLIELERELSRMLLDFQWKNNTPEIRTEIKLRADIICEKYVNKNGLYNFFNKIDEENNTPEIIDNNMGILDTYVEPIKGMGIIVNNIVILNTGAISSGGFMLFNQ